MKPELLAKILRGSLTISALLTSTFTKNLWPTYPIPSFTDRQIGPYSRGWTILGNPSILSRSRRCRREREKEEQTVLLRESGTVFTTLHFHSNLRMGPIS